MQKIRRRKFGEMLVAENIISRENLQAALQRQRGSGLSVGELLLQEGMITESDIVRCVCSQYQLPYIRTATYQYDVSLINKFGADFLFKTKIVPLDRIGDCVIFAVAEVPHETVERKLIDAAGCDIYYYVSSMSDVENTLRKHFKLGQEKMMALNELRRSERAQNQLTGSAQPAVSHATQRRRAAISDSTVSETQSSQSNLLKSFDASWESIFDEAEKNLNQG